MELFRIIKFRDNKHLNMVRRISGTNIDEHELSKIRELSEKRIVNDFYKRRSGASTFALLAAIDKCLSTPNSVVAICGCSNFIIASKIKETNSGLADVKGDSIKFYNGSIIKLSKTFDSSIRGVKKVFIDGPMNMEKYLHDYMTVISHEG